MLKSMDLILTNWLFLERIQYICWETYHFCLAHVDLHHSHQNLHLLVALRYFGQPVGFLSCYYAIVLMKKWDQIYCSDIYEFKNCTQILAQFKIFIFDLIYFEKSLRFIYREVRWFDIRLTWSNCASHVNVISPKKLNNKHHTIMFYAKKFS